MLIHQFRENEALVAFRRADERGSAKGAFHVGLLLYLQGKENEATTAFSRADERGDARRSFFLGVRLAIVNSINDNEFV